MNQLIVFLSIGSVFFSVPSVSGESRLTLPEFIELDTAVNYTLSVDCSARAESGAVLIMRKDGRTAAVAAAIDLNAISFTPLPVYMDHMRFNESSIAGVDTLYKNITVSYYAANPDHTDSGTYSCEIGNTVATYTVRVLGPPYDMEIGVNHSKGVSIAQVAPFSINLYPITNVLYEANVNIAAEGDVTLTATAQATPETPVTWYRKEADTNSWLEIGESPFIVLERNWDTLESASYLASAVNKFGSYNGTINIVVEYPPRNPSVIATDLWPSIGGVVSSGCTFDAIPPANIFYAKEDKETGEWRRITSEDGFFYLSDILLERDVGTYKCVGTNQHGKSSANITVHGKPQEALVADLEVYSTSVDIELLAKCATEVQFTITLTTINDQGIEKIVSKSGETEENQLPNISEQVRINKLEPSTVYKIRATVTNDFGSLEAAELEFTTSNPGLSRPTERKYSTQALDPNASPSLLSSLVLLTFGYILVLL